MLLSEVLKGAGAKSPRVDVEITGISFKPDEVKRGDLFVSLHEGSAAQECRRGKEAGRGCDACTRRRRLRSAVRGRRGRQIFVRRSRRATCTAMRRGA